MDSVDAANGQGSPLEPGQPRTSIDFSAGHLDQGRAVTASFADIGNPSAALAPSQERDTADAAAGLPGPQNPDAAADRPCAHSHFPDTTEAEALRDSQNPDTAGAERAASAATHGDHLADLDAPDAEFVDAPAATAAPVKLKRTAQTEEAYAYRVRQLWRQTLAARTTDPQSPPAITPLDVVDFLLVRAQEVKFRTWTLYRSALLWDFGERATGSPTYREAYNKLASTRGGQMRGVKPERTRASAKARAGIPEADLGAILNQLAEMNGSVQWGARTQYWLQAGIATGVRPSEWDRVSWADDEKTWLLAPITKQKVDVPAFLRGKAALESKRTADADAEEMDGPQSEDAPDQETPAHAPASARRPAFRAIAVKPEDRLYVDLHLASMHSSGLPLQKYYANCRTVLWRACRKIWKGKKLYCLYSARHQFSANFKAENPLKDVAEAMGHNDEGKRATNDYAPARLAYGRAGERNAQSHSDGDSERSNPLGPRAPQHEGGQENAAATLSGLPV